MDERGAFESWYSEQATKDGVALTPADVAKLRDGDGYGAHRIMLNGKWEGWQARAAAAD